MWKTPTMFQLTWSYRGCSVWTDKITNRDHWKLRKLSDLLMEPESANAKEDLLGLSSLDMARRVNANQTETSIIGNRLVCLASVDTMFSSLPSCSWLNSLTGKLLTKTIKDSTSRLTQMCLSRQWEHHGNKQRKRGLCTQNRDILQKTIHKWVTGPHNAPPMPRS